MDEAEVLGILKDANLSATAVRKLNRDLREIRGAGTAYTLGERLPGAGSISAPVFDHGGTAIASVNVLSLESRLNAETVRKFRRLVRAAAMTVSGDLGWQPNLILKDQGVAI
jgi:DNA-binding IclR family transcriptional regulator